MSVPYCFGELIIKTCRYHIFPGIVEVSQIFNCSMTACLLGVAWGFQGGVKCVLEKHFLNGVFITLVYGKFRSVGCEKHYKKSDPIENTRYSFIIKDLLYLWKCFFLSKSILSDVHNARSLSFWLVLVLYCISFSTSLLWTILGHSVLPVCYSTEADFFLIQSEKSEKSSFYLHILWSVIYLYWSRSSCFLFIMLLCPFFPFPAFYCIGFFEFHFSLLLIC